MTTTKSTSSRSGSFGSAPKIAERPSEPEGREALWSSVRASSLGTLERCARRWAMQRDIDKARAAHPDLREDAPTYKTPMGSAFHAAVESRLMHDSARDRATVSGIVHEWLEDLDEAAYDSGYRNVADVVTGVEQMLRGFWSHPVSERWLNERSVKERSLDWTDGKTGFRLTGTADLIDIDAGMIHDLKTTSSWSRYRYDTQTAAYRLMASEGDYQDTPFDDHATIVKVVRPRNPAVGGWDAPAKVEVQKVAAKAVEPHVVTLVRRAHKIASSMDTWQGDYTKLPCAPGIPDCNWCVARGTSLCPETTQVA